MNATILCVGKLREAWQRDGCAEYLKRLSRYGRYEVVAVDDERESGRPGEAQLRQIRAKEGAALLKHVRPGDRVIALCIVADAPDSVALSRKLAAERVRHRRQQRPVERRARPRRHEALLLQPHLSPRPDARNPAGAAVPRRAHPNGREVSQVIAPPAPHAGAVSKIDSRDHRAVAAAFKAATAAGNARRSDR